MSQNDDELQTPAEVVHGIFQAAQDFCTQTIAGNANYKKVVWPLVEDQLDRYAGIRQPRMAAKGRCFGSAGSSAERPRSRASTETIVCALPLSSVSPSRSAAKARLPSFSRRCAALLSGGRGLEGTPCSPYRYVISTVFIVSRREATQA